MITSDSHMHTEFSTDSDAKIQSMIESAIAKGLRAVCITDHMDLEYPFHEDTGKDAFQMDLKTYFSELEKWKHGMPEKFRSEEALNWGFSHSWRMRIRN